MLTPPALPIDTIIACLHDSYGLRAKQATFLPIGADINAAVYRVEAENGTPYFLKLKRDGFDEIGVAVPALLHAQGIRQVMAPLETASHQLWTSAQGFVWILYPFFEGHNGYAAALSDAQWTVFGQSLKAIHAAILPPGLAARVPRESYSPQWRDIVLDFDRQVTTSAFDDPIAQRLATFWALKRHDILAMVKRAEQLGQALQNRAESFVLCHADLHPGNILVGACDELAIVDWDNPIFAPKEHDLMCLGGGVSDAWNDVRDEALFYQGYRPTQIDPIAIAYYRYERIVADVAAYGEQIFGVRGSEEDREEGLHQLMGQFLPNQVVAIAHRTYEEIPTKARAYSPGK